MKKGKKYIRMGVWAAGILLMAASSLLARSSGAPTRKTGSARFNEPNCTQCHAGTANSGSGKLDLTGVPDIYTPGQTYNVRVTLEQAGAQRWGFELAARTNDGNQAGTLQAGADGFSQVATDGGVQFITHTSSGTRAGTANGPVNFDFTWKAPDTNAGEVYFSVAGNAANNSSTNSGDSIYTREKSSNGQAGGGGGQGEPQISSVMPNTGPLGGNTPIMILGKDFAAGATVTIGGQPASNVVVVEDSRITAFTPAVVIAGPVDVVVTSSGRTTFLTGGFTYVSGTAASPAPKAVILPYVIDDDAFRTNLGMSNLTGSQVEVEVHFADLSGTVLATKHYVVPGSGLLQVGNVIRDILGQATATRKSGYLILEPSVDDSIIAYSTPIDNFTQDSSVVQGTRGKSAHLLLPTSTSTGLYKTTLTLVNDSNANNTVEIKLRNTNGDVLATKTVTLAPYGSFNTENLHEFLGVTGTYGPVELRSMESTPKPIAAVSKVYTGLITAAGNTGTASAFFVAEPIN